MSNNNEGTTFNDEIDEYVPDVDTLWELVEAAYWSGPVIPDFDVRPSDYGFETDEDVIDSSNEVE